MAGNSGRRSPRGVRACSSGRWRRSGQVAKSKNRDKEPGCSPTQESCEIQIQSKSTGALMAVTVRIPAYLAGFAEGKSTIEVANGSGSVRGLLQKLWQLHPALKDRVVDEQN